MLGLDIFTSNLPVFATGRENFRQVTTSTSWHTPYDITITIMWTYHNMILQLQLCERTTIWYYNYNYVNVPNVSHWPLLLYCLAKHRAQKMCSACCTAWDVPVTCMHIKQISRYPHVEGCGVGGGGEGGGRYPKHAPVAYLIVPMYCTNCIVIV